MTDWRMSRCPDAGVGDDEARADVHPAATFTQHDTKSAHGRTLYSATIGIGICATGVNQNAVVHHARLRAAHGMRKRQVDGARNGHR